MSLEDKQNDDIIRIKPIEIGNDIWELFDDFNDMKISNASNNNNIECNSNKVPNSNTEDNVIICYNKECGSLNITVHENTYICDDCNTLQDKFIDTQAEWRYYGSDDTKKNDPTRCGMPVNNLLPELSLGSVISNEYTTSYHMYKIRKYQNWNSTSYRERSLYEIIDNITLNASNSGISQTIIDEAKVLYNEISKKKISRGSNRKGLIASSLYMSCKKHKVPRSAKEIAKIFNIDVTTMTKGCKKFHDITKSNVICSNPEDFIIRFCCNLNISDKYLDLCKSIILKAEEYSIVSENAPPSIAAGIIFLVSNLCNIEVNKKDISQKCDISEVTINKCYKKLNKYKKLLITEENIKNYKIKIQI